jgi:uncharacterized damage-inducible protein DinB
MTISETLLPEFDQEMANTRKILACVPEDKFTWKPHEKSMTLGRLASHVAEMANWAAVTVNLDKLELKPGDKPFNAATSAELLGGSDKYAAEGRAAIAGAGDESLGQPWSLVYGGHTLLTMPRAAVLRGMVMNHMIHHRGQLSVYLRLNDVAVPGMYGPSADEKTSADGKM